MLFLFENSKNPRLLVRGHIRHFPCVAQVQLTFIHLCNASVTWQKFLCSGMQRGNATQLQCMNRPYVWKTAGHVCKLVFECVPPIPPLVTYTLLIVRVHWSSIHVWSFASVYWHDLSFPFHPNRPSLSSIPAAHMNGTTLMTNHANAISNGPWSSVDHFEEEK